MSGPGGDPNENLSVEEMRGRIRSLVTNWECPACGVNEWTWNTDQVFPMQWATKGPSQWTPTGTAHPAIPFICTHCGYVRFHLPIVLDGAARDGAVDNELH